MNVVLLLFLDIEQKLDDLGFKWSGTTSKGRTPGTTKGPSGANTRSATKNGEESIKSSAMKAEDCAATPVESLATPAEGDANEKTAAEDVVPKAEKEEVVEESAPEVDITEV